MKIFGAEALMQILQHEGSAHDRITAEYRDAVDRCVAWTTSMAVSDVATRLAVLGISAERQRQVLRGLLHGVSVVWVGPRVFEAALEELRDSEPMEAAIARLIADRINANIVS